MEMIALIRERNKLLEENPESPRIWKIEELIKKHKIKMGLNPNKPFFRIRKDGAIVADLPKKLMR